LGRALAGAFAQQGCRVAIVARGPEPLQSAAAEIAQNGAEILALPCDICRRDHVRNVHEQITAQWGGVQIVINGAGIARAANFAEMADDLRDDTLKTNLTGAYNCCKVFLPAMLRAGWGRIINIASTTAKASYRNVTAYTASKHGLLGLTRSLALVTARHGVTVNSICPGYVDDERTHRNAEMMAEKTGKSVGEILKLFAASSPQNRLIAPEEVASLALLMASEKLGGMTGQAVSVDGGAVMV